MEDYKIIEIYTDGSAAPNPGPGGFGVVAIETTYVDNAPATKEIIYSRKSTSNEPTTNNREELKAMIDALEYVNNFLAKRIRNENIYSIIIHSDSSYVINTCNNWIGNWEKNDWRNSKNVPVQNVDLLIQLNKELHNYRTQFNNNTQFPFAYAIQKVAGHDCVAGNEYADALATNNAKKLDEWYDKMLEV